MSKAGKNGVTANTPKNIPFGAGTIHKNLKYTEGKGWNFDESIVGATSGGSKYSVIPEVKPIEIDGVLVRAKGLAVFVGNTNNIILSVLNIIVFNIVVDNTEDVGVIIIHKYEGIVARFLSCKDRAIVIVFSFCAIDSF